MAAAAPIEPPKTFVFCPPPPGKPDPKEKYPGDGQIDRRSRVVQHSSKSACWYYVFNMMRERIGQHPDCQALEKRTFEKIASKRRKEFSSLNKMLVTIEAVQFKQYLKKVSKATVLDKQSADYQEFNRKFQFEQFLHQNLHSNLYDFLSAKISVDQVRINETFFREAGVDPALYYDRNCQLDRSLARFFNGKKWDELSTHEKRGPLDTYARLLSAEKYGLRVSPWQPTPSIDELIKEISSHGPLFVSGPFGKTFYSVPPTPMNERMEGRTLYFWKPNDPKKEHSSLTTHCVLLVGAKKVEKEVGAKKVEQEHVYFIDPNDGCDPANPASQIIYVMSYKRLTTGILDLYGNEQSVTFPEAGFAYYGPRIELGPALPAAQPMAAAGVIAAAAAGHAPEPAAEPAERKEPAGSKSPFFG